MECWRICCFFFQAEDGIRGLVRSRGLGDVYKRQELTDQRGSLKLIASENYASLPVLATMGTWLSDKYLSLIHI